MFYKSMPEFLDSGRKSWALDFGPRTPNSGRWTPDARLWTLNARQQTLKL